MHTGFVHTAADSQPSHHVARGDLVGTPPGPALAIGGVTLANRVFLAPMAGITDAPFRALVASLGAGAAVSEMTASETFVEGCGQMRRRAQRQGPGPHIVQIAGCDPATMAAAAALAEDGGADVVDINMGCPNKRVINGLAGAALMRDLDAAIGIVAAVVDAVRVPVSLKMRLGWDEHSINAPELARRAQAAGVRLITVHGRTRRQFYEGPVDPAAIRRVKDAVGIPVIANGDIASFAAADAMLTRSGADGIMIGRAAQGRPWFPGQLARYLATGRIEPDPDLPVQHQLAERLYEALLSHYGVILGMRHARKHLGWALNAAASATQTAPEHLQALRRTVLTCETPRQTLCAFAQAFARLGAA